jgi:hypothetical protein
MELYKRILAEYFAEHGHFEDSVDYTAIIQNECYRALCKIKQILENDALEDADCFQRIEEIVSVFESLGSNAGCRHDFG